MPQIPTLEDLKAAGRKQLHDRTTAFDSLAAAQVQLANAEAEAARIMTEAEHAHADAWAAAETAGWTAAELRAVKGLKAPTQRRRPRKRTAPQTKAHDAGNEPAPSPDV